MVGITNPFVTSFKPLIDDIAAAKGELEQRAAVASHECMFNVALSHSYVPFLT